MAVQPRKPAPITVVGVGNLVHTDDGLGIHAIQRLQADPRVPKDVALIDGGTFGLELLAYLQDCSQLILIDAADLGQEPGTLVRMTGAELCGLPCGASVHQLGVADLLATLPLVSDVPCEILLLGAQPASTDWGTELTAPVAAALDKIVDAAVQQLQEWFRATKTAEEQKFLAARALAESQQSRAEA
ncbi:MAG TPA: HyaD/HybD family hydrogenase maturation endopeptidase [Candidatus Dormibacteraeota bacterium]|nr:HyaD/HybD family hydrogenase maturation endopeptidase [Candidatus Dormibacteraeota bacterium]